TAAHPSCRRTGARILAGRFTSVQQAIGTSRKNPADAAFLCDFVGDRDIELVVLEEDPVPRANFRLAQGRKRTSSAGRGLRDDLSLHLQGNPTGRAVMALS